MSGLKLASLNLQKIEQQKPSDKNNNSWISEGFEVHFMLGTRASDISPIDLAHPYTDIPYKEDVVLFFEWKIP